MDFYWWFAIALVFFIVEIATPGFFLLWFGVGAVISGLLDVFGIHEMTTQVLVFVISSIVLVTLSRTIFKNIFMRSSPGSGLKTNMEAMIGKIGIVTEKIDIELSTGRILVEGQDWSARTDDSQVIDVDSKVKIVRSEGAKLIVVRV